jgi:hypothetical protein
MERGKHWGEDPGMVIVHDLTDDLILAAIDDFLQSGEVEVLFEPADES